MIRKAVNIILENELLVARGTKKAELVLKKAGIINVFTEDIQTGDVAICNGRIVGIGEYEGEEELDCAGKYVAPGFIDGHIHLESSMLKPVEFAKTVLPHGTTAVIADPHEIANVCGAKGIKYMLKASEGLPLDIYYMLPSCVPSTAFDESGCSLGASDLEEFYQQERILGLAEVMDYIGTIRGDSEILQKIARAKLNNKIVDGHAPGLHGRDACAYVTAGISSDHECVSLEEAKEKLGLGQWIMIRQGTAARNLEALIGLLRPPYHQRVMLVTDDKHPYDLLEYGHMEDTLRQAVELGADPCIAIKTATFNTASYFGLKDRGAVAPGYLADIVILSDLKMMKVEKVIKNGKAIYDAEKISAGNGEEVFDENKLPSVPEPFIENEILNDIYHTFHNRELSAEDFKISEVTDPLQAGFFRAIQFQEGEITTKEISVPIVNGRAEISVEKDILKLAAIERHHGTGHIGIGFAGGYGLKKGAIASSVSHDAHNIIVIGTNDTDIAAAANCIRNMQGGWAITKEGEVLASLELPVAGLISDLDARTLAQNIMEIKKTARELGVSPCLDPFMTLAFVSLPVIPELRLTTSGLFHVGQQKLVPIII